MKRWNTGLWFSRERWKASQPSSHSSHISAFGTKHKDLHQKNLPGPIYLLTVLLTTEEYLQRQVTDLDESNPNIYY